MAAGTPDLGNVRWPRRDGRWTKGRGGRAAPPAVEGGRRSRPSEVGRGKKRLLAFRIPRPPLGRSARGSYRKNASISEGGETDLWGQAGAVRGARPSCCGPWPPPPPAPEFRNRSLIGKTRDVGKFQAVFQAGYGCFVGTGKGTRLPLAHQ